MDRRTNETAPTSIPVASPPSPDVLAWLDAHGVRYGIRPHTPTDTARDTASELGVPPRQYAKVVAVETRDGQRALLVVGARDFVDLHRAAWALAAKHVRLLTEEELVQLTPGCEAGALPALALRPDLRVCADPRLRQSDQITFPAGSHCHALTMARDEWERAANVEYYPIAETHPTRPELVEWY